MKKLRIFLVVYVVFFKNNAFKDSKVATSYKKIFENFAHYFFLTKAIIKSFILLKFTRLVPQKANAFRDFKVDLQSTYS